MRANYLQYGEFRQPETMAEQGLSMPRRDTKISDLQKSLDLLEEFKKLNDRKKDMKRIQVIARGILEHIWRLISGYAMLTGTAKQNAKLSAEIGEVKTTLGDTSNSKARLQIARGIILLDLAFRRQFTLELFTISLWRKSSLSPPCKRSCITTQLANKAAWLSRLPHSSEGSGQRRLENILEDVLIVYINKFNLHLDLVLACGVVVWW